MSACCCWSVELWLCGLWIVNNMYLMSALLQNEQTIQILVHYFLYFWSCTRNIFFYCYLLFKLCWATKRKSAYGTICLKSIPSCVFVFCQKNLPPPKKERIYCLLFMHWNLIAYQKKTEFSIHRYNKSILYGFLISILKLYNFFQKGNISVVLQ